MSSLSVFIEKDLLLKVFLPNVDVCVKKKKCVCVGGGGGGYGKKAGSLELHFKLVYIKFCTYSPPSNLHTCLSVCTSKVF